MPDGTRLSLERTGRAELAIALWTMDAMLGVRAWALYMYHRSYQRETVAIRIAKGSASDFLVNTSRTAVYGTAVTTRSASRICQTHMLRPSPSASHQCRSSSSSHNSQAPAPRCEVASQSLPCGSCVETEALNHAASLGDLNVMQRLLESSWPSAWVLSETLALACHHGHEPIAQLLLQNGAAIEPLAHIAVSAPLYRAADSGHASLVHWLLERGAQIDRASTAGDTALSRAAFNGHPEVVKLLLDRRASIDASRANGPLGIHTPLKLAIEGEGPEKHASTRWLPGEWSECSRLLKEAENSRFSPQERVARRWAIVRTAVHARLFAPLPDARSPTIDDLDWDEVSDEEDEAERKDDERKVASASVSGGSREHLSSAASDSSSGIE